MSILRTLVAVALLATVAMSVQAQQSEYQLGRGLQVNDGFTVGSYFSTEYALGDDKNEFIVDDLAVLFYGALSERFSYLVELESIDAVSVDFENDTSDSNLPPTIERLYGDYKFSDYLSFRIGKQITPIGYWNLQPINVLRETTSNPLYSRVMFPKFLTGVDMYGFAPFDESLTYHVFVQNTRDMDRDNINISVDSHYGVSLEKTLGYNWKAGGSAGRFEQLDRTRTRYLQLNTRYDSGRVTAIAEAIRSLQEPALGSSVESTAAYLQGEYHVTPQHGVIGRVEYFHDGLTGVHDRVGILGYSFRPVYPVSIKFEYQWHSDSHENQFLSSFSVLF